jgi:hypothetical protein
MSTNAPTTGRAWRRNAARTREALSLYGDPLATLIVALAFAVAGVAGVAGQKVVAAATLLVLAAVAGVMLRQRHVIEEAKKSIDMVPPALHDVREAIKKVDRTVDAVTSHDAYELLDHAVEWDVVVPDGSVAHAKRRKRLRFNQDDVVSIYELGKATGGSPDRTEEWTFDKEEIEEVGKVSIGGEDYVLIGLGYRYQRNDELTYTSTRVLRGLFTDAQNRVSHRVREHTYQLRVRVMWPAEGPPPKRVRIEESVPAGRSKSEEYEGTELESADGRPFVERSYDRPPRGQLVAITWWTETGITGTIGPQL